MGKYGRAGDGTNHGQYGVPIGDEEAALAAWHADHPPGCVCRTQDAYNHAATALVLTEQEWGDLAFVAHHFLRDTEWVLGPEDAGSTQWPKLARRRALAERIIEANQ